MRPLRRIIMHYSETPYCMDFDAKDIDTWHRDRGFTNGIGYHYVVKLSGEIEVGRKLEMVGAHTAGHNGDSIGICYIGGKHENGTLGDTRTPEQRDALELLIQSLRVVFPYNHLIVLGHNDYDDQKVCPGFNAKEEYN